MQEDLLTHKWPELRRHIRLRWPALGEDDVYTIDGSRAVLMALLQEKYGYASERAEYEIERFIYEIASRQPAAHLAHQVAREGTR